MVVIYTAVYDETENSMTGSRKREAEHESGRKLLKQGLRTQFGIDTETLLVEKGPHGKPYLPEYPNIHFNISHCAKAAVCALGDVPVGIDVEQIRRVKEKTAGKVLTNTELSQLHSLPETERDACFLRFWTLKESYGKVRGLGLSMPLQEVEFTLPPLCSFFEGEIVSSDQDYTFRQGQNQDVILALCVKGSSQVRFEECTGF